MQVILHTGVHCTDEERLIKCLLRNGDLFSKSGIAVPGPSRYRNLLRDTLGKMNETPLSRDAREVLLDAILDEDTDNVDRLLLSNSSFFAFPQFVLRRGRVYANAVERLENISRIFDQDQIEMFLSVRNPATFLPALFALSKTDDFEEFLSGLDPFEFRWSDFIAELRQAVPEIPITVWANEDTPLIWGQVIREIANIEPGQKITGAFDIFSEIISDEGMRRFRTYLKEHPVMTEIQRRRVMVAFLDKFAIEDKVEEELDIPGWTEETINWLTEKYEDDIDVMGRIHGVTLISP